MKKTKGGAKAPERKIKMYDCEMIMIDRDTLEELLVITIARGESLGYVEADDNYRQLLRDLRAAQQGLRKKGAI